MKRCFLSLLFAAAFFIFTGTLYAANAPAQIIFQPLTHATMPTGRQMTINRTAIPPKIDGRHNDACWKHAHWSHFRLSNGMGRIKVADTIVKACYDSKNIYFLFYALRGKTHPAKNIHWITGHDDNQLFHQDNIQLFLQPGGPNTTIYQIAVNPAGGIYDLSHRNTDSSNVQWNAANLKVVGNSRRGYFLEMSIPFADLGACAPAPGQMWRVDFCRFDHTAKEAVCWAPTGTVFNTPARFGVMIFAGQEQSRTETGNHTLRGKLIRPDGKPASYVLVRAANSQDRTDTKGEFTLKHVAGGKQTLGFISPAYHPLIGRIDVAAASTQTVAPITLTPVDPYIPAFTGAVGTAPAVWLNSSIVQPFNMKQTKTPATGTFARKITLLAAPGQYQSRAVAVYLNRNMPKPAVTIQWNGSHGRPLTGTAKIQWIQRALRRVRSNAPREQSNFVWRFVRDHPQSPLLKGQVRMILLTIHVPANIPSGHYRGVLTLTSQGKPLATLPLTLRVADFHLTAPTKRLGMYYIFKSDKWTSRELADIHAHGGSLLIATGITPGQPKKKNGKLIVDTSKVKKAVNDMSQHGFKPPYIVYVGEGPFYSHHAGGKKQKPSMDYARVILGSLKNLRQKLNIPSFIIWWGDEIFNHNKLPGWLAVAKVVRPNTSARIFVTLHNGAGTAKKMAKVDPYIDIRCYNGWAMDKWLTNGHTFQQIAGKIKASGDTAWTYYNNVTTRFTPEWQRLTCGYWLWRSPFMANLPWIYHDSRPGAIARNHSPFNTMDGNGMDLGLAFDDPKTNKIVSTLDWEAYRQGYNDLCYLATLEQAVKKASPSNAAAKKAKQWLKNLHNSKQQTVSAIAAALTAKDYRQRRAKIVQLIDAIHSTDPTTTTAP